jgi:hypothetical protein
MSDPERFGNDVFLPPTEVRRRLADNLTEARMLRRLLRVVEDAAEERHRRKPAHEPRNKADGRGVGHED